MKKVTSIVILALIASLLISTVSLFSFADEDEAEDIAYSAEYDTAIDEDEDEEKGFKLSQEMKDALLVIIATAVAAIPSGIGSALGVRMGGIAAAGVTSEKPELFGKLLVLQALPGTQGIYGFLTAVLILVKSGILGGTLNVALGGGWKYVIAALPIGIVGLISAIYQANVGVAGIHMTAKSPESSGKGVTMAALVETYAILALLVSILLVFFAC